MSAVILTGITWTLIGCIVYWTVRTKRRLVREQQRLHFLLDLAVRSGEVRLFKFEGARD